MPNPVLTKAIDALASRHDLTAEQTAAVLAEIMAGNASEVETAGVLVALRTKGETVEEIVGLATTMRAFATPVTTGREADLIDTAGTGGGRPTFNVSTTAALIAAGAGCAVAKHGNRSATGLSGSADVLEALGVRIDLKPDAVARCIAEVGFGFMFAPAHHGATRFVVPVRKELAVRTIFNFLGPLTNPAGATRQVIGVSDPNFLETIAGALARLGARKALVVSSADGLDEMSTSGITRVVEVDGEQLRAYDVAPEDVGLARAEAGRADGRHARRQRRDHAPDLRRRARPGARCRRAQRGRGDLRVRERRFTSGGRAHRRGGDRRRSCRRRVGRIGITNEGAGTGMSVLDDIVDDTRAEVKRRRKEVPLKDLEKAFERRAEGFRPFSEALTRPGVSLIAEHKRRSPSAGKIRKGSKVAEVVQAYERGGAAALSILTEPFHFGGSLDDLREARANATLPVLRKDFIVDKYQLYEAAAAGADAILLIVAALEDKELGKLLHEAAALDLDALVEVHDERELARALEFEADVLGINNRDLSDFSVDIERTFELLADVPAGKTVVSESGFSTREQLDELERVGVDAVLIGETLMRASDIEAACRELTGGHA